MRSEKRLIMKEVVLEALEEFFSDFVAPPSDLENPDLIPSGSVWDYELGPCLSGGYFYIPLEDFWDENPKWAKRYAKEIPDYWICAISGGPEDSDPAVRDQIRRNSQYWHNQRFAGVGMDPDEDGVPNWLTNVNWRDSQPLPKRLGTIYPVMTSHWFNPRFSGDVQKETRTGTIGAHENPEFPGESYSEISDSDSESWCLTVRSEDIIIPLVRAWCEARDSK